MNRMRGKSIWLQFKCRASKNAYIGQPHELEVWEDSFDDSDEEVHGVDVDEGMLFDVAMLDFDGDDFAAAFDRRFVDLGQARDAQRLLVEVGKNFQRLEKI